MLQKISIAQKLGSFHDLWQPRIVAQINDTHVKLTKLKGEFEWHHHVNDDELFLVIAGRLTIQLRDGDVELGPGEMLVVPHGVEHRPVAVEEVHLMLIEPAGTLNTGNVQSDRTVADPLWI